MGFFKTIKEWLNQDYGGRYVSCVLKELLMEEPKIANAIFKQKIDFTSVELEVSLRDYWPHLRNERRADITLLNVRGDIVGLIEIKYDDQKCERNHAQILDYIRFCKRYRPHSPIPFVVITKSPIPEKEELQIKANKRFAGVLSYGDVVRKSRENNLQSPVSKMVEEYLREEAFMFNPVDKDALQLLMHNSLNVRYNHGQGRQYTHYNVINAPKALENLIINTGIIGDRIHYLFKEQKARPITRFNFAPEILDEYISTAKKDLDEEGEIDASRISAGKLYVYYHYNLYDNNAWMGHFEFGFYVELNVDRNSALKTYLYSNVWHNKHKKNDYYHKEINISRLTEDVAYKTIRDLLRKSLRDSLNRKLSRDVRKRLVRAQRAVN